MRRVIAFIYIALPISALWLFSAWEQGMIGGWAAFVSFALMLLWGAMCEALPKKKGE